MGSHEGTTDAPGAAMVQSSIAREITFEAESEATPIALELDRSTPHSPRFVTGAVRAVGTLGMRASEPDACVYCGASGWAMDHTGTSCAHCGAPVRSMLPPPVLAVQSSAPSLGEAVIDATTSIPFGFWKRLPVYAFLALVLGNGCRCGGLSGWTNVSLAVLVVVGVAGVVLSLQRNP